MKIIRHLSNGPKMHDVVEFGDLVYVAGMTSDEVGIAAQTRDVLRKIDEKLAVAGSDKNHILRATIYLISPVKKVLFLSSSRPSHFSRSG